MPPMRLTPAPQRVPPGMPEQVAKERRYHPEPSWESIKNGQPNDAIFSLLQSMDVEDIPAELVEEAAAMRQKLADAAPKAAGRPKAAGLPPASPASPTSPLLPKAVLPSTYVDELS